MSGRVVFIGASKLGLLCLQKLIESSCCEIVGAVTVPETFPISYSRKGVRNVLFADVGSYCNARGIDCSVMRTGMEDPDLLARVRAASPDLFIVAGWYHMVPKSWRALAPAYGIHASLLPDYSGGAPLVWAMINGETETGVTLFRLASGVDDGPVVGQASTNITPNDTIATLCGRIELLAVELLRRHLPHLADGTARLTVQDERRRRLFPQRTPEDGAICWSRTAQQTHDFVRAQTKPYPGAFALLGKDKVTIWSTKRTEVLPDTVPPPGGLAAKEGLVYVGCGQGSALQITSVAVNGIDIEVGSWWSGIGGDCGGFDS